jgi:hypothetical protein
MRDFGDDDPDVGWNQTHDPHVPVYHQVQSRDEDSPADNPTGLSTCGTRLIFIGPAARYVKPYERPCAQCWRDRKPEPRRTRRVAIVRTPLVVPSLPAGPMDLRVPANNQLAIRGASGDPANPWLILDITNPLFLQVANDDTLATARTLRSLWPTEKLVTAMDLAERFTVDRSLITRWRLEQDFPPVSVTVGASPGWYPELMPLIDRWRGNRTGRTGRPPKDP